MLLVYLFRKKFTLICLFHIIKHQEEDLFLVSRVYGYTSMFSHHFTKGNNFHDFLFATLFDNPSE